MSRVAVLTGRVAADAVVFAVQAVLVLAVATPFGFRVSGGIPGYAAIAGLTVVFGLALAVLSGWFALLLGDPETAERVLYFPAIALAFISSAFAPVNDLAAWMQPIARASPVTAAAAVIRALAAGGPLAAPLVELGGWLAILILVPGVLAVRRWNAPR
jgi:ABC-2 type transport system permease protein